MGYGRIAHSNLHYPILTDKILLRGLSRLKESHFIAILSGVDNQATEIKQVLHATNTASSSKEMGNIASLC